ncbi:two-component response regulator-like PRR95 [Gastrolobium bilobum]|uniref:two-component response regulator-like PRR95 n=1 Tax=Gastrolobium bilobum TaxID=150636 RepID=UPI002AAFDC32|nr:two-component response regulator-like PRR95 [Gastrolobium bilobum]
MDEVMELKETQQERNRNDNDGGDRSVEVVKWERFLPRMMLRVLLVESDHSTRQIITALLKKCSYKVTAVPDGLKAWEMLKRKGSNIDLILTEVELPAISGFALLSFIMEHDICKNIPVIMMSSHDSVSMVLKCMLKGAADFLIKPVRRNELRNLWHHVWRKHGIRGLSQNTLFPQKKLKSATEDNSAINQSSGSAASSQKNNECIEKLSEAQSTCTSPFLEAESASMENMQDASLLKSSSILSNIDMMMHEEFTNFESESTRHNEKSIAFASEAERCNKTFKLTDLWLEQDHGCAESERKDEILTDELNRDNPNMNTEAHGCSDERVKPSRAANLIATFENLPKHTNEKCSLDRGSTTKFDFDTQLGLSLRRDCPGSSCKQASEATEECQRLNHSNTSAFSWYSGCKLFKPLFPTPPITSAKVNNTNWDSQEYHKLPEITAGNCCQYGGSNQKQENMTTTVLGRCGQVTPNISHRQYGPLPVIGVTSNLKPKGHIKVFTSVFCEQSGVHPIWNQKPVCQKESSPFPTSTSSHSNPESHNSDQHHHWSDDATCTSLKQNLNDKSNLDHVRHDSPAAGQNADTSLCHDAANLINSIAYGSIGSGNDGNATSPMVAMNDPENFSDSGCHYYDGFRLTNSRCSSHRDAALTKFRLKRKGRCYEKKVRYQSRKRLAEQRPRVKGQFVRQVYNDHPVPFAGGDS